VRCPHNNASPFTAIVDLASVVEMTESASTASSGEHQSRYGDCGDERLVVHVSKKAKTSKETEKRIDNGALASATKAPSSNDPPGHDFRGIRHPQSLLIAKVKSMSFLEMLAWTESIPKQAMKTFTMSDLNTITQLDKDRFPAGSSLSMKLKHVVRHWAWSVCSGQPVFQTCPAIKPVFDKYFDRYDVNTLRFNIPKPQPPKRLFVAHRCEQQVALPEELTRYVLHTCIRLAAGTSANSEEQRGSVARVRQTLCLVCPYFNSLLTTGGSVKLDGANINALLPSAEVLHSLNSLDFSRELWLLKFLTWSAKCFDFSSVKKVYVAGLSDARAEACIDAISSLTYSPPTKSLDTVWTCDSIAGLFYGGLPVCFFTNYVTCVTGKLSVQVKTRSDQQIYEFVKRTGLSATVLKTLPVFKIQKKTSPDAVLMLTATIEPSIAACKETFTNMKGCGQLKVGSQARLSFNPEHYDKIPFRYATNNQIVTRFSKKEPFFGDQCTVKRVQEHHYEVLIVVGSGTMHTLHVNKEAVFFDLFPDVTATCKSPSRRSVKLKGIAPVPYTGPKPEIRSLPVKRLSIQAEFQGLERVCIMFHVVALGYLGFLVVDKHGVPVNPMECIKLQIPNDENRREFFMSVFKGQVPIVTSKCIPTYKEVLPVVVGCCDYQYTPVAVASFRRLKLAFLRRAARQSTLCKTVTTVTGAQFTTEKCIAGVTTKDIRPHAAIEGSSYGVMQYAKSIKMLQSDISPVRHLHVTCFKAMGDFFWKEMAPVCSLKSLLLPENVGSGAGDEWRVFAAQNEHITTFSGPHDMCAAFWSLTSGELKNIALSDEQRFHVNKVDKNLAFSVNAFTSKTCQEIVSCCSKSMATTVKLASDIPHSKRSDSKWLMPSKKKGGVQTLGLSAFFEKIQSNVVHLSLIGVTPTFTVLIANALKQCIHLKSFKYASIVPARPTNGHQKPIDFTALAAGVLPTTQRRGHVTVSLTAEEIGPSIAPIVECQFFVSWILWSIAPKR
jgi:hypothetical protein